MYLLLLAGRGNILYELIITNQLVSKCLQGLCCIGVMHQHHCDIVQVDKVIQLHGEVYVSRNEYHSGRGRIGVSKPAETLSELIIRSILCYSIDMD